MKMDSKKIVEGLVGGVLFGFTAGIGFILATRIMTKKVVIESKAAEAEKKSSPKKPDEEEMNFSSFNQGAHHIAEGFINENKTQKVVEKNFDFTTGSFF